MGLRIELHRSKYKGMQRVNANQHQYTLAPSTCGQMHRHLSNTSIAQSLPPLQTPDDICRRISLWDILDGTVVPTSSSCCKYVNRWNDVRKPLSQKKQSTAKSADGTSTKKKLGSIWDINSSCREEGIEDMAVVALHGIRGRGCRRKLRCTAGDTAHGKHA